MADGRAPGSRSWQRSASEDLWERTLNQIGTKFGQLAYLSRLRNPETERYEHHGLTAIFGEQDAEAALRRSHLEVLESFLGLGLLDQRDDVAEYAVGLPQSAKRVLASWEKGQGYLAFLPQASTAAQKELFDANLRVIVRHLRLAGADEESQPVP